MRWQEVGLIPVTNASHAIGRLQCAIPWVTHRGFTVSVIRTCCGNCARNSRCRCDHISETLFTDVIRGARIVIKLLDLSSRWREERDK